MHQLIYKAQWSGDRVSRFHTTERGVLSSGWTDHLIGTSAYAPQRPLVTDNELTVELQEILNEEHQETQRNVSPSEQEEDERGPMPTSAIKDLLKKWKAVRAMISEWHPKQAHLSRVGDLYNNNAIICFRKILKKREK
ncbi:uncharacterized protein TNCV_2795801 [Trichonephila clavipes]|nr:uncharacterized protein TNCV_2795801 [Trichonephila clavipes]